MIERVTTSVRKVKDAVLSLPQRYNVWLGKLPSTNFRIQWTMVVVLGTAIRYWTADTTWTAWRLSMHLGAWEPSYEWLAFMAVMAGIDSWQFAKKRDTVKPELLSAQNAEGGTP